MFKKLKIYLLVFLILFFPIINNNVKANSASQDVIISVNALNEITLSKSEVSLAVTSPTESSVTEEVSDASTTMSYSTNESNQKITAELDRGMPLGITLMVEVASTSGTSEGQVVLEEFPEDIITGLSNISESGQTVTYTVAADMFAEPTPGVTYTITYTITSM
ncbi:MAG: hypothetical protein U5K53_09320 [Halanaerobiales bacterium]|nr:hypothetical protein [Halanaerobiales bacterium]